MCKQLRLMARKLIRYDPVTGEMFWQSAPAKNKQHLVGLRAGTIERNGYWHVRIAGVSYAQHRLVWLLMYGRWPEHVIDHIDGDRLNNSFGNLRDVPQRVNAMNRLAARSDSVSGVIGVRKTKSGKWNAYIYRAGTKLDLGTYCTADDASAAYSAAKAIAHKEAAHV